MISKEWEPAKPLVVAGDLPFLIRFRHPAPGSRDQCERARLELMITHAPPTAWWLTSSPGGSRCPEKAFSGNGNMYKDQAKIAELERLLGQAHAENELLKKAFAMTQRKIREERLKPTLRDGI